MEKELTSWKHSYEYETRRSGFLHQEERSNAERGSDRRPYSKTPPRSRAQSKQLATDAGITKSYLSKIENSDSAPPVSTLVSLAHAFGVTIDAFFSEQVTESVYTIVKKTQRQTRPRQGTRFGYSSYVPLAPKFPGRYMEPILLTVPPELKTPKQFQHVGQEFLFVLEWQASIQNRNRRTNHGKGRRCLLRCQRSSRRSVRRRQAVGMPHGNQLW